MIDVTKMWDFSDPAASESRFRRALAGASPRDRHVLMPRLARAEGLEGRYDDALALLEATEPLDPEIATRIHLERGRVRRSGGSPERARPDFEAYIQQTNPTGKAPELPVRPIYRPDTGELAPKVRV